MKNVILLLLFLNCLGLSSWAQDTLKIDNKAIGMWQIKLKQDTSQANVRWQRYLSTFPKSVEISKNRITRTDGTANSDEGRVKSLNLSEDHVNFKFEGKSTAGWDEDIRISGEAKLRSVDVDRIEGTYEYKFTREGGHTEIGTLSLELSRIWCCGNHTPNHCGDNIIETCKKIH